jgi:zinc/manganese transport system substrate-binding protein
MKGAAVVAALSTGTVVLTGCGTQSAKTAGVVNVVAGENFWGDIVSQIGGDHVKVTSIISDPNTDPHEYESSNSDAIAIATSQLVVVNGLGYDDFVSKLVEASPSDDRTTLTVADVLGADGDANPHLWYDTTGLPKVASAIADALGAIDPGDAVTFTANAQKFDDSLQPILDVIAQIKSTYAGTPIAYTERVPGYLVEAAGLTLGIPASFTQAVEDDEDPSPKDTAAFDDAITDRTVKVLLYNAQVTDQQTDDIKQLAASSGVPVVGVTETMPPGAKDFQSWQLDQAQQLLTALGG